MIFLLRKLTYAIEPAATVATVSLVIRRRHWLEYEICQNSWPTVVRAVIGRQIVPEIHMLDSLMHHTADTYAPRHNIPFIE